MNCCVVVSHGCFSHVCWYRLIGIVGSWMIMEVSAKSWLMGWTFACSNKHHLTRFGDLISSNGPGVRYEIVICIQTRWIVWINGPFLCGIPNRNISREWLNYELKDGELYLVDCGYHDGQQYSMTPNGLHNLCQ